MTVQVESRYYPSGSLSPIITPLGQHSCMGDALTQYAGWIDLPIVREVEPNVFEMAPCDLEGSTYVLSIKEN